MARPTAEIIYENTVPAIFLHRINRFTAAVLIDGQEEIVHVKNTGRLENLLLPRAKATLQKVSNPERKTGYDLISVYKPKLKWVNIDSLAPNELMKQYWISQGSFDVIKPEYNYGNSRIDFYLENDGRKILREVKGCTLVDDDRRGAGLFPDAPTERGVKHLKELTAAAHEGHQCSIDFVIQMNGIHLVLPNDQVQPEFRIALSAAVSAGVQVCCFNCHVDADRIKITGINEISSLFKTNRS